MSILRLARPFGFDAVAVAICGPAAYKASTTQVRRRIAARIAAISERRIPFACSCVQDTLRTIRGHLLIYDVLGIARVYRKQLPDSNN